MPANNDERKVDATRRSPISYEYAHKKIRRVRGKAATYDCADCGWQASQWAGQDQLAHGRTDAPVVLESVGLRPALCPLPPQTRARHP